MLRQPLPAFPRRLAAGFILGLVAGCGGGGGGGNGFQITPGSVDVGVDRQAIVDSLDIIDRTFAATHCAVVEGAVPAGGTRRLLRFDTIVVNHGSEDLFIGSPSAPVPPLTASDFVFSPCHGHYHFSGWADYTLLDASQQIAAFGHKQAFCLEDSLPYTTGLSQSYDCLSQGISSGWGDDYDKHLDGQWVDITGVPEGDYTLVVTVNAAGKIVELLDIEPNTVSVPVHVPDPNFPP